LVEAGGGVARESEASEVMLLVEDERESGPRPPCDSALGEVLALKLAERMGEPVNQSP
jgi:hypothetical protein